MTGKEDLRHYFYLLWRWWWLVVGCTALAAGTAYAYNSQIKPVYTVSATLLIQKGSATTEVWNVYDSERLARTQSQMIKGRPVMESVIAQLGLPLSPEALAKEIKVEQVPDTGLIHLSTQRQNPVLAAQIINAVAEAYVTHTEAMQQGRYADYLDSVQAQMEEMATLIEETTAEIAAMGTPITQQEQAELARLETTLAGYRNTHAVLWNNYEQMRLTAILATDSVVIFEKAQVPRLPDPSGKMRNMMLAAAIGAMIGSGIGFLIEYLDDTIKSPEDVTAAVGLNTLGVIGKMREREGELVVSDHPRSPIAEAYRRLRTNVRFSDVDNPLHTILVTSANITEGKSVTVANLALAMAQAGLTVAVVDADLRRPRQHHIFGLDRSKGLTESLLKGELDDNLHPSDAAEGLRVLPSGDIPPNPAELLGSQRMSDLLDKLSKTVDMVIIDSPPLLPVTDAGVLAQSVDGVLLVIEVGRTRRGAVEQAVKGLRQINANLLGVVLNAVPTRRGGRYHYYYYYYQGYYQDSDGKRHRRQDKRGLLARLTGAHRRTSEDTR